MDLESISLPGSRVTNLPSPGTDSRYHRDMELVVRMYQEKYLPYNAPEACPAWTEQHTYCGMEGLLIDAVQTNVPELLGQI